MITNLPKTPAALKVKLSIQYSKYVLILFLFYAYQSNDMTTIIGKFLRLDLPEFRPADNTPEAAEFATAS